jgi:hypothetical protein
MNIPVQEYVPGKSLVEITRCEGYDRMGNGHCDGRGNLNGNKKCMTYNTKYRQFIQMEKIRERFQ